MKDKHALTEKLKILETEIHNEKIDLSTIERKLNSYYAYEEELDDRVIYAKNQTNEQKKLFFAKAQKIGQLYSDMKNIFDVFTGNFYKD